MKKLSRKEIIELYNQEYQKMLGEWAEQIEREKIHDAGHEEGFAAGRKQGIAQNSLDIAKRMLAKNKPIEEITEFTGLSKKELSKLIN